MTIQLVTHERLPLRQLDWPSDKLPYLLQLEDGTYHKTRYNTTTNLWEYAPIGSSSLSRVPTLILLALLVPGLAWAQLPPVQIYGQDSGTPRAVTVTASGLLSITCANCSGSGASFVDDAAFTAATDSGAPMMGFVSSDTVDSGDVGVVGMLANRQLKTTLYDSSGVEVTSFGGGTQYAEDAVHSSGNTGTLALVVRNDAGTALAADGDNIPLMVNSAGSLYTTVTGTVTVGSHAVTNAGTFATQVDGSALTALQLIDNIVSVEDAVAGSAFSGVGMLAVRQDSHSDLAADGDFIPMTVDADGGLRVSLWPVPGRVARP